MPRTDYDELWEKQSNGSMNLVKRTSRIVSDEEIEKEQHSERLRVLITRPVANLTPAEKDDLLEFLVERTRRG
ncbi:hypothetical protein LCGC14_3059520 [marine sediment metagenome]|uniref:Uncharacterized protein n=1 Tax=marine sediment metagenome TaxID=412755 RepID=A0A0F8WJ99_9ZZZZ